MGFWRQLFGARDSGTPSEVTGVPQEQTKVVWFCYRSEADAKAAFGLANKGQLAGPGRVELRRNPGVINGWWVVFYNIPMCQRHAFQRVFGLPTPNEADYWNRNSFDNEQKIEAHSAASKLVAEAEIKAERAGLMKAVDEMKDDSYLDSYCGPDGRMVAGTTCSEEARRRLEAFFGVDSGQSRRDIQALIAFCSEHGNAFLSHNSEQKFIEEVAAAAKGGGRSGNQALASLIEELLSCRNQKIDFALRVARELPPSQELAAAVRRVMSAPDLGPQPPHPRFHGEIEGGGKVGWLGSTAAYIRKLAATVLEELEAGGKPANEAVDVGNATQGRSTKVAVSMIRFVCPSCSKSIKATAEQAGKHAKCPGCGNVVEIPKSTAQPKTDGKFLARDNMGTRFRDKGHADSHWNARYLTRSVPFVMFEFQNGELAREAIKRLSFISEADDTGELISTTVVEFGCFERDGKGEVVICGDMFSKQNWAEAKEKLGIAGGKLCAEREPADAADNQSAMPTADQSSVEFVREEHDGEKVYRIHQGLNQAAAMDFLKAQSVSRRLHYIVVETPEGTFGRDIDGIYKE
jgi:hypothetical protein